MEGTNDTKGIVYIIFVSFGLCGKLNTQSPRAYPLQLGVIAVALYVLKTVVPQQLHNGIALLVTVLQ